jgi:hypothetical protein
MASVARLNVLPYYYLRAICYRNTMLTCVYRSMGAKGGGGGACSLGSESFPTLRHKIALLVLACVSSLSSGCC